MRLPDPDLLPKAIAAFRKTTGLDTEVTLFDKAAEAGKHPGTDGGLTIAWDEEKRVYLLELKATLTNAALGGIAAQIHRTGRDTVLVTRWVTTPQAERLRELGVQFIDTAGNAYFRDPPLLVYIAGRRPLDVAAKPPPDRPYRPAGLRVLFALLCEPELTKAPVREIAAAAGTAVTTVKYILDTLETEGYMAPRTKKRGRGVEHRGGLYRRETLLRRWVETYPETLRPKLVLGRYTAPAKDWWRDVEIQQYKAQWGGEIAADRLLHYLKPGTFTLYVDPKADKRTTNRLLLDCRLKPDENGRVEVLKKFWQLDQEPCADIVPPLLVYADLLAIGDPRTVEAAEQIHDRYLAPGSQTA